MAPPGAVERATPGVKLGSKLDPIDDVPNRKGKKKGSSLDSGSKKKPNRHDGDIGLNNRYRLGEVSFGLH